MPSAPPPPYTGPIITAPVAQCPVCGCFVVALSEPLQQHWQYHAAQYHAAMAQE